MGDSAIILVQNLHLISLLVYIFMAGYVLYKNPKSLLNKTSAILISSFAIWNIVDVFGIRKDISENTAVLFQNISSIGWIVFASLFLCFSLVFSKKEKMLKKNGFLILIFIVPTILIFKQWSKDLTGHPFIGIYGWEFKWEDTIWSHLFYAYYSLFTLLSIFIVFLHGIKTKSTREKNQSRIIVATVLISLIGGTITDVILPLLHIHEIPQIGNVIILVFAGGMLYSIVKYRFLMLTPAIAAENIISTMAELLILSDHNGNIISLNNAVSGTLKYEQNELSGKSIEMLLCQDDLKESLLDRMAAHGERIKNYETCILTNDAKEIPVILSCSPLKDDEGDVKGIVFVARDISEQKRAADELKRQKEEFEMIFNLVPAQIWYKDTQNNFIRVNRQVCSDLGMTNEIIEGHSAEELFPSFAQQYFKDDLEVFNARKPKLGIIEQINNAKGELLWVHTDKVPVFDKDGQVDGLVAIIQDITQLKLVEKELIEAKNKAEESDRLKSAFLANMSHEIRTPLNSILGFSELLSDSTLGEEEKNEFIRHIINNGHNLLSIINNIMDISKLESGELGIYKTLVNAQKFISECKEHCSIFTERKKLSLDLIPSDNEEDTIIIADVDRLRQIFINLVDNAFKFTENGRIEIGCRPKDNMAEFYVKDTGIGIPSEYHDVIFDHFRQVETEMSRKYGGNGLGLAISKRLVELMDGKIWLESEPGKGSIFYFTLPTYQCE